MSSIKNWISGLFRKNTRIAKSRKVTKARFLYLYIIFGSIAGFSYLMTALVLDLPLGFALTPLYLLLIFVGVHFLVKNWKTIWLYVRDMEQGKMLLFLNKSTHWTEERKMKVVAWIYLRRKTIRKETHARISNKIMEGENITDEEKAMFKFKSVYCPQQLLEGFNKALLVHALIYAHENIQVLDSELRDIMELTVENIHKFNIQAERKKAGGDEYDKYMAIGERVSNDLKSK